MPQVFYSDKQNLIFWFLSLFKNSFPVLFLFLSKLAHFSNRPISSSIAFEIEIVIEKSTLKCFPFLRPGAFWFSS